MKHKSWGLFLILVVLLGGVLYTAFNILYQPTYRVRFDSNGGSKVERIDILKNKRIEESPKPTKEGYVFKGWYNNDELFDFSDKISEDLLLEAKWEKAGTKKFKVYFCVFDPEKLEVREVEENTVIGILPIPKKEGYEFKGWFYQNKEIKEDFIVSRDMTVVAKWQKSKIVD